MASEINSGGFLRMRIEMIVSNTPRQTSSRLLQMAATAFAALLLPLGAAYAQNPDVRAVSERLERAVKAGEMSQEQMDSVLRMLKQSRSRADKNKKNNKNANKRRDVSPDVQKMIDNTRRRVRELVEAGEMTREEAGKAIRERVAAIQKRAGAAQPQQQDKRIEQRIEAVKRRVREAVESGDMSPEEARKVARERIAAIQDYAKKAQGAAKGGRADMAKMRAEHEQLVRDLTKMVEAGKLSREDMERKVMAHRKGIAEKMERAEKGGKKSKGGDDARWQRLERAVKNGDMTQEQAKQKYREWEMAESKKAGADAKKGAKRKAPAAKKRGDKRKAGAKRKVDPEAMRARLDQAVERGMMTKEQAKQRWEAFRKEMGQEKAGGKEKAEGARRRRAPKRGGDR